MLFLDYHIIPRLNSTRNPRGMRQTPRYNSPLGSTQTPVPLVRRLKNIYRIAPLSSPMDRTIHISYFSRESMSHIRASYTSTRLAKLQGGQRRSRT